MPTLPVMYDGPLPPANVAARLYLYDYVAFLDDAEALQVPSRSLDAIHAWDDAIVSAILARLMVPLARLATLEHGTPTSRTNDTVKALRKYGAMAPASWAAAQALAAQYPVAACELEEVHAGIAPWSAPPPRDAPVDLGPRRTRSTARIEAAVAALNESEAMDEEDMGHVRRSRRASERAARQREEEVRERARHVLGRTREPTPDEAVPLHLEAKVACLVQLCDALSTTTTKSAPFESPLHTLVQAVLDRAPAEEKAARYHTQSIDAACDAEMRACQRRAPSMASSRYAAWKQEVRSVTNLETSAGGSACNPTLNGHGARKRASAAPDAPLGPLGP